MKIFFQLPVALLCVTLSFITHAAEPADPFALPDGAPPAAAAEAPASSSELQQVYSYLMSEETAAFVVGVSKQVESIQDAPMPLYIVTRKELNRFGTTGLYETLSRTPGLSYYNIDSFGQLGPIGRGLYSIWRYGFSIELAKMPDYGHMILAPRLWKSIEVARGPGGGLTWGSAAEAGLFNLTLRDDVDGVEATAEVGFRNRYGGDVLYGKKFGDVKRGDGMFFGIHYEQEGMRPQLNAFDEANETWIQQGTLPSFTVAGKAQYHPFKFVYLFEHADHIAPHIWFGPPPHGNETMVADLTNPNGPIGLPHMHDNINTIVLRGEYNWIFFEDAQGAVNRGTLDFFANHWRKQYWIEALLADGQELSELGFKSDWRFFNSLDINAGGDLFGLNVTQDLVTSTAWAHRYGIDYYDVDYTKVQTQYRNLYAQARYEVVSGLKLVAGGRIDWADDSPTGQTDLGATRLGVLYTPISPLTLKYLFNMAERRPMFNEQSGRPDPEYVMSHDLVGMLMLGQGAVCGCHVLLPKLNQRHHQNDGESQ